MINKWRVKIIQRRIYKVKDPFMRRDQKREREKQPKPFSYSRVIIISTFNLLGKKIIDISILGSCLNAMQFNTSRCPIY